MKAIWKTLKLRMLYGKEYKDVISRATRFGWMIEDSTKGDISHFHNIHGDKIRGWHKRSPSFMNDQHPLETYYKNK